MFESVIGRLQGGLVVSCQAPMGSPLDDARIIAALALTAEQNGAVGVRLNGCDHIAAVRNRVKVPIIGIEKLQHPDSEVSITPDFRSAQRVGHSGATIVALDSTGRRRPGGEKLEELIRRVRTELGLPVMADISTFDEGLHAVDCGADLIATTLSGFTGESRGHPTPAIGLVEQLSCKISVPVVCEGGLSSPEDVRLAFASGAFAVVVGAAITGLDVNVRRFVAATPGPR